MVCLRSVFQINIDNVVISLVNSVIIGLNSSSAPRFQAHGGSLGEDLALQNAQARSRMVLSYLSAQLLPWSKHEAQNSNQRKPLPSPLVLSSANLDECLYGYLTK